MHSRNVVIHMDRDGHQEEQPITVYDLDTGNLIVPGARKLKLTGTWIMRRYNNPVPCGATIVLYPEQDLGSYEGDWELLA